jgi:hypothetical protein
VLTRGAIARISSKPYSPRCTHSRRWLSPIPSGRSRGRNRQRPTCARTDRKLKKEGQLA